MEFRSSDRVGEDSVFNKDSLPTEASVAHPSGRIMENGWTSIARDQSGVEYVRSA